MVYLIRIILDQCLGSSKEGGCRTKCTRRECEEAPVAYLPRMSAPLPRSHLQRVHPHSSRTPLKYEVTNKLRTWYLCSVTNTSPRIYRSEFSTVIIIIDKYVHAKYLQFTTTFLIQISLLLHHCN